MSGAATILEGDVLGWLAELPDEMFDCIVTSPPYWGLRSYPLEPSVWGGGPECAHEWQAQAHGRRGNRGVSGTGGNLHPSLDEAGQGGGSGGGALCGNCGAWRGILGAEPSIGLYVEHMVEVFRGLRRVLKKGGTAWCVIGDSFFSGNGVISGVQGKSGQRATRIFTALTTPRFDPGLKPKDLCGIPWRVALALQADGWWIRSDIIWQKPNVMPSSVKDRPTSSHEHIFLLAKSRRYHYDYEAVKEPLAESTMRDVRTGTLRAPDFQAADGKRSRRDVWTVATATSKRNHFAAFPPKLIEPCILAGTSGKGNCPECGAPWVRSVERSGHQAQQESAALDALHASCPAGGGHEGRTGMWSSSSVTTGWKPSCECGPDPVPATILDPFLGSGTTALVAVEHGRDCWGIEAAPEYAEMAFKRLQGACVADVARFSLAAGKG